MKYKYPALFGDKFYFTVKACVRGRTCLLYRCILFSLLYCRQLECGCCRSSNHSQTAGLILKFPVLVQDKARKQEVDALFTHENTGINFDAYEDIPVRPDGWVEPADSTCEAHS